MSDETARKKTTYSLRLLTREARTIERREGGAPPVPDHWRPKKRSQCAMLPRPCPYVGCRHHLFLDTTRSGGLTMPFGDDVDKIAEMPETCALDVADRGPVTLEEISLMLNLTRERVRQIETDAIDALSEDVTPFDLMVEEPG